MPMLWIDYIIIGIISISLIVGLFRGFIKEALALTIWAIAVWASFSFSSELSDLFIDVIAEQSLRIALAGLLIFICILVIGALINYLLGALVDKTGLTGTDRMLGLLFGIARGGIIITLLVMLAGLTPLPKETWWKQSLLIPHFQSMAIWLRSHLPDNLTVEQTTLTSFSSTQIK